MLTEEIQRHRQQNGTTPPKEVGSGGLAEYLNVLKNNRYMDPKLDDIASEFYDKAVSLINAVNDLPTRKTKYAQEIREWMERLPSSDSEEDKQAAERLDEFLRTDQVALKYRRVNATFREFSDFVRDLGVTFAPLLTYYHKTQKLGGIDYLTETHVLVERGLFSLAMVTAGIFGWLKTQPSRRPSIKKCQRCELWFVSDKEHKFYCSNCHLK